MKISNQSENLKFGLKSIESLSLYYNYEQNIMILYSYFEDEGIILQNDSKVITSSVVPHFLSMGIGFLIVGLFLP